MFYNAIIVTVCAGFMLLIGLSSLSVAQDYTEEANKSVDLVVSYLERNCDHLPKSSAQKEQCLADAGRSWLIRFGRRYEHIPSNYITGNDIAEACLTRMD